MAKLSAEAVWNGNEQELLELLNSKILMVQNGKIRFYAPSFTYYKTPNFWSSTKEFPTISITGHACTLNCKHCGGKVLQTMHPAQTPDILVTLCRQLKQEGAVGVLVSGGCLPDGSVPLSRFIGALAQVKRELSLTVYVHTGIIDLETARQLKAAGVDAALIDVLGCDETIQQIYNLNTTAKHYEDSLKALHEAAVPMVPHVIVGLHNGNLRGEFDSLKVIQLYEPSAVVIISFMPIHGTAMENAQPPKPLDIARTLAAARLMFPETPVVLGCMRPKGKHRQETDVLALKAGVNGIAFPAQEAVEEAKRLDLKVYFSAFCCAQIYGDSIRKT